MVYIFSIAQIKKHNGKLCGFLVTDSKREKKGEIFLFFTCTKPLQMCLHTYTCQIN